MRFVKGHGTENDFVLLPDPDGELRLGPELVTAMCDRRAGIGADGLIRVVRSKALGLADEAEWFMDYWNSDGTVSEMCGNGVRVFARYLVDSGLAAPGSLAVLTRGGVREVRLAGEGDVTVDMGAPVIIGAGDAVVGGRTYSGLRVSMGNPHLACHVDEPVADLDLSRPPAVDPAVFADGVNVEFFRAGAAAPSTVDMRVHERGSGETRSCGTGAVAAAVAAAHEAGRTTGSWDIVLPGGRVEVTLDGTTSFLRGPAVLVAEGEWL